MPKRVFLFKICGECGQQFQATHIGHFFCSGACRQKAWRREQTPEAKAAWAETRKRIREKLQQHCNTELDITP
jgi:hypothetical protein